MRFLRMFRRNRPGHRAPSRTKAWPIAIIVAFSFGLLSCSTPLEQVAPPPPTETSYRLGTGDLVRITVFGQKDLSGEYRIDGSGDLTVPLVGRVHASGTTSSELKQNLEKRYREYLTTPDVSVEILNYRPFYIVGEVQKPGNYPYVDGMTIINGVAIAGGFTYRANTESFYIQRKDDTDKQFSANQTTAVRPGDVIVVRERFF